jgi:uncharacterized membrane protein YfcA
MAPLLILVFKVDPLLAVGSDLAYSAPTKIVGAFIHARQRTVDGRVVLNLSIGGIIGIVAGWYIVQHLRGSEDPIALARTVRHWVGLAVCASAALTILSMYVFRMEWTNAGTPAGRYALVLLGIFVGVSVMTTSVGAGAITMPFLCLLLRSHKTQLLIGSDLAFSAVIATLAAALQFHLSNVNFGISAAMLIGAIPGVIVGSRLATRIPDWYLKLGVGILLLVIGVRML